MPHYGNLNDVQEKTEITINNLPGWFTPLVIEYGYVYTKTLEKGLSFTPEVHWKVKDTAHIFTVPIIVINQYPSYEDHFKKALIQFRIDYLDWLEMGMPEKWMREYQYMFKNMIQI